MHQQSMYCLSKGHPLNAEPMRPWPWKVLIGYRALGNRKVVATRSIHVRAAGHVQAEVAAIREARQMPPLVRNGQKLVCSRVVSSRPLDRHDAIGA